MASFRVNVKSFVQDLIEGKEDNSNKVTSLSTTSTHIQYASAKSVVDYVTSVIGDIEEDMLQ